MTTEQIELLFNEVLEKKAIYNDLTDISENKIYNWRKGRGPKPTIGDMLNVLYQLKKIRIERSSPEQVDFLNKTEESWKEWDPKNLDYTRTFQITPCSQNGSLQIPEEIQEKLIEYIKPKE